MTKFMTIDTHYMTAKFKALSAENAFSGILFHPNLICDLKVQDLKVLTRSASSRTFIWRFVRLVAVII